MTKHKLPKGFLTSGIHCGAKKKRKDLSLFFSKKPCRIAALFTKNKVKAAPVLLAQEQLAKTKTVHAVLVNSGNANCMTGRRGMQDAKRMVQAAARKLKVSEKEVLVSSTGVIGQFMPMNPILKGIPRLVSHLSEHGLIDAADGILTTDKFHKIACKTFTLGGKDITLTGVAKGAGMIDPNMATMLCYILTDVNISPGALKKALKAGNEISFNAITVDGDMSTNDTVMIMSNGESGNKMVKGRGKDYEVFLENLNEVMNKLAGMIVHDGEGATKFVQIKVKGAKTKKDAKLAAEAIANSLLTKCAVHGGDPNWGRVASSVGSSGAAVDPDKIEIKLDGLVFFANGTAKMPSGKETVFKSKNVGIEVNLHLGRAEATVYTCDISKKYITLNAHYTT